ncbi:PepSY-associated TM helix domain-containing protein [Novosphingobium terrae]|uniref:PepSY-associated TM helix domain-containing protein n=1 Tax=Novosphingobium terrae TaxID=2726189 RepID=UPI00197F87DA|nr:PepSY-associated TM helix domain-containing protein [Novosphingobium terrae]
MLRTYHRILALLSVLLMLYLGVTGTGMQLLDLYAIARHAPITDPTIVSINEGRYGNGDIQVMSDADLTGHDLPAGLDYDKAVGVVLAAMHRDVPDAQPRFVELRLVDGRVVGQARLGPTPMGRPGSPEAQDHLRAWDAITGEPARITPVPPLGLPDSLRQDLKELHRFWGRRDVPGVYAEFASGLILWVFIVTGLILYWRLYKARVRIKRPQLFWSAGGMWRTWHRAISLVSALFIILVAATGTWLGFESSYHVFAMHHGPQPDTASPLSDTQIRSMTSATLTAFREKEPETPIRVLRVRLYATMPQGGVVAGSGPAFDGEPHAVLFNTRTGKVATLGEPEYPVSGFPLGTQVHEDIKHLHSGMLLGLSGRAMNLLAGLALIWLSVSGMVMYWQMYAKRRQSGRNALFWK